MLQESMSVVLSNQLIPERMPIQAPPWSDLAPTRAHPPHTTTPCHYISYGPSPRPCGPPRRRLWWGGPSTCSGTGRLGGRGGPLWVPGLTTRSSMHRPKKLSGREPPRPSRPVPLHVVWGGWALVGARCAALTPTIDELCHPTSGLRTCGCQVRDFDTCERCQYSS